MLEEAENKARRIRGELISIPKDSATVHAIPGLVERYAQDLRSTLGRNVHHARALLSRLLGEVILRPDKDRGLTYEMRGNLGVLLEGYHCISAATGAGRGIWKIPLRQLRLA